MAKTVEQTRTTVAERLRARQPELEQATLARMFAVSAPTVRSDPEYAHGLRLAVAAAIEHALCAMERSEERPPSVPPVLLAQARLAARAGIGLDTVMRRYLAGYTLLGDYVIHEAEGILKDSALQALLRAQAALLDRLLAAVGEEYRREQGGLLDSAEQRRADRVKRLLAGELVGTGDLGYELEGHHLGIVAVGSGAVKTIRGFTSSRGCRLLLVRRDEGAVWAWLGWRREFDPDQVEALATYHWPPGVSVAIGEPGKGLGGWRLTHRQARAALPIAHQSRRGAVRYSQVALLASMLRDDLLVTSLRELYLAPLAGERDGGDTLQETLRAYFAHDRNITSAAATLRVARQTVKRRLHTVEQLLGCTLGAHAVEIEAALRLEELTDPITASGPMSPDVTSADSNSVKST
jgi:hypothetical protein